MGVSAAQTIAAAGLISGQGIAPSQPMATQISRSNQQPLIIAVDNLYADNPSTMDNITRLQGIIDKMPSWASGRKTGGEKVSSTATTQANQIIGSGSSGVQNFSSHLGTASSYGSASLVWAAAITAFSGKGFKDLGLHNASYHDIASGGLTGHFGGLATARGGPQNGAMALGQLIASMGKAINLKNMKKAIGPVPLILKMREHGLNNVGFLDYTLAGFGIYSNDDVDRADPKLLTTALSTVNDPNDIRIVIESLEIKVPANVGIRSLADLCDANKMLPPEIRTMSTTGQLSDLNKGLGGMGGNYKTQKDLSMLLGRSEIPTLQFLGGLTSPVPPSAIALLAPAVGIGTISHGGHTQPLGTGPLGNPTMKDMLGVAAGIGVIDNFQRINNAHERIMNTAPGQNLRTALLNLYHADRTNDPTVEVYVNYVDTAIGAFNQAVKDDPTILKAEIAMVSTILQLNRSTQLLGLAGVNLASPPTATSKVGVMQMAASLPKFGVDKNNMGYKEVMGGMADSRNVYGEAVYVSLLEGRNTARQQKAGVTNSAVVEPSSILATQVATNESKGLTDQQKENIIADCKATGADPKYVLQNAGNFGYNNAYYVKKGYPAA